jgi:hypothetical protein
LRLTGKSSGYSDTAAIASRYEGNPDHSTIDVYFDNVPTNDSYTLTYIAGDGQESNLFDGASFDSLRDFSEPQ